MVGRDVEKKRGWREWRTRQEIGYVLDIERVEEVMCAEKWTD